MPIPLAIPLITGITTAIGGAFGFFGQQNAQNTQQEINQDNLEYQQWLNEQQFAFEKEKLIKQTEIATYIGIAVLFVILLIVVTRAI